MFSKMFGGPRSPEEKHEMQRQKVLKHLSELAAADNGLERVASLFREQTTYANYQKRMYGIDRFSIENFSRNLRALGSQCAEVSKKIQGPKAAEFVMHLFATEDTSALKEFIATCLLSEEKQPFDFLEEYYPHDMIAYFTKGNYMRQYMTNVRLLKERVKDPSIRFNQYDHFNALVGMKQEDFKSWLELMQIKTPEQFKLLAGFLRGGNQYPYSGFGLADYVKNMRLVKSIFGEESWTALVRGPRPTVIIPQEILPEHKDYYDVLQMPILRFDFEYKPKDDSSRPSSADMLIAMKDIGLDATAALYLMAFGHHANAGKIQKLFSGSRNSLRYLYERDRSCELLKQYLSLSTGRLEMFFAHQTLASKEDAVLCADPSTLNVLQQERMFTRLHQAYVSLGFTGGLAEFFKLCRSRDEHWFKRLQIIMGKSPAHAHLARLAKEHLFRASDLQEVDDQSATYILDLLEAIEMPFEPDELAKRIAAAAAYTGGVLTHALLKEMCSSEESPERVTASWGKAQGEIRSGAFDINNPTHVELEYLRYVKAFRGNGDVAGKPGYRYWENVIKLERSGQREELEELAIAHATYETIELRKYIRAAHEHAKKISHPLWVVPNYSYGLLHVAPIKEQLEKEGVRVVLKEKVGSSESHSNPFVVNPKLFENVLEDLVEQQPIIIVTDGSSQLFGKRVGGGRVGRKDGSEVEGMRLPDAHRGYFNAAVAINEAMYGHTLDADTARMWHDAKGLAELRKKPEYQDLLERAKRALAARGVVSHQPYSIGAWNLTNLPFNEDMGNIPKLSPTDIKGPALVMCAMGLLDEQLPANIREDYRPGFFDDSGKVTCFNIHFSNTGITLLNTLEIGIRQKLEEYDRTGTIKHSPAVINS